jgi:hypothetical protein
VATLHNIQEIRNLVTEHILVLLVNLMSLDRELPDVRQFPILHPLILPNLMPTGMPPLVSRAGLVVALDR